MNHRFGLMAAGLVCTALSLAQGTVVAQSGRSRTLTYYVAADEVDWDYAPAERNLITGTPYDSIETMWVDRADDRIGRVYRKSVYREYTDGTFRTPKPRPTGWEHLGFLGPLLRAEVGDTIVVVFRNNTTFASSMHPHGVFYTKSGEGAPSADRTGGADKADDEVPPGGTHTYVWPVPERAGPAGGDLSSILWMYHSHVHEGADVNAGLMGPMIVSRRGATKADGTPRDVDREFIIAFYTVDENRSRHAEHNVKTYTKLEWPRPVEELLFTHPFGLSNVKESLNGFLFGNIPGITTRVGERVRWYLMASTNFEVHAPHWHGNTVVANHMRTDVTNLATMQMLVAEMEPDNPGTWLFHCHVGQHLLSGMQSHYTVLPRAGQAAARPQGRSP